MTERKKQETTSAAEAAEFTGGATQQTSIATGPKDPVGARSAPVSTTKEKASSMDKESAATAAKASKAAFHDFDDMATLGRENMAALVASGRIAVAGLEEIASKMTSYMRSSLEEGMTAAKAMVECKDVKELLDLQARQTRRFFDAWLAEGTALSELSIRTMTDAWAPIGERVNASVDRLVKAA